MPGPREYDELHVTGAINLLPRHRRRDAARAHPDRSTRSNLLQQQLVNAEGPF
jgi:hypothetical protein